MSKREELLLLDDILNAGKKILKFSEGMNFQQFMKDEKSQDACIRNFEIMGEHQSIFLKKQCFRES
jgi:uncharacterized protein with HEPN domain